MRPISSITTDTLADQVERDIRAELDSHVELCAEDLVAQGIEPAEALRRARERFGNAERIVRRCRRTKIGGRLMAQRIQLAVIAVLVIALFTLYARSNALRAEAEMERARAHESLAMVNAQLEQRRDLEPVEHVVVEIGDFLETMDRHRAIDFGDTVAVGPDGKVLLVNLGWIKVAGMTRDEVSEMLNAAYAVYYEDLTIDVRVTK